jgi:hypothetical protein
MDLVEGFGMFFILLGNLDPILEREDWRFELRLWRENVVFSLAHVFKFVDVVLGGDNLLAAARAKVTSHNAEACRAGSLLEGGAWHCAYAKNESQRWDSR